MYTVTMAEATAWVAQFFWPFVRIGAMLMVVPLFGTQLVSARVRIFLAALVAILLVPVLEPMPAVNAFSAEGVLITIHQVLIGAAMGFILQLVFGVLAVAGENIAMTMGLGFAMVVDPQNGVSLPVVSQFLTTVAALLFMAFDGHLMLMQLVAESFLILPVGAPAPEPDMYRQLALWGRHMFIGAVMVALPAITALLLVNLAMGIITRAAPQLNIFSVGFPMTLLVGLFILYLSIPSLAPIFHGLLTDGFEFARRMIGE